ncbi:MAG: endonuclease III [Deltaproteobacteria bacterium]|nr:endonuclease III [Deltaproteobacteria bacterium]
MSRPAVATRLSEAARLLAARFGRPRRSAHAIDPVRNLVLTILSQNTNDANRDRAFASLMSRFPTLPSLAGAKPAEVESSIRAGGLARAKAKAILSMLARLSEERGGYDLSFLGRMPLPEARAYLTGFPGIGVKTASVVLLFSFGRPAFPVDTHILRVSKRLGLVPPSCDAARATFLMEPHVPAGGHVALHLNMIRLGREICRPRDPRCPECPLLPICPEGRRRTGSGGRG